MKQLKNMKFDELVDWAAGHILKQLIAGKFRAGVIHAMDQSILWYKERKGEN